MSKSEPQGLGAVRHAAIQMMTRATVLELQEFDYLTCLDLFPNDELSERVGQMVAGVQSYEWQDSVRGIRTKTLNQYLLQVRSSMLAKEGVDAPRPRRLPVGHRDRRSQWAARRLDRILDQALAVAGERAVAEELGQISGPRSR